MAAHSGEAEVWISDFKSSLFTLNTCAITTISLE
jgi:hypothetical protein